MDVLDGLERENLHKWRMTELEGCEEGFLMFYAFCPLFMRVYSEGKNNNLHLKIAKLNLPSEEMQTIN